MFALFLCLIRPFFANGVGVSLMKEIGWKKIIKGKFGEEKGGWRSGVVKEPYGVGVWKEIGK